MSTPSPLPDQSGRALDAPKPWPLYEHGGGRELSTKQWDHYKEPVVHVVPVGDLVADAQRHAALRSALAAANRALCEARNCLSPGMRAGTARAIQVLDAAAAATSAALDETRQS